MDFFKSDPLETKVPKLLRLPDGRWRMWRYYRLPGACELKPLAGPKPTFPPAGTPFTWTHSNAELQVVIDAGIEPSSLRLISVGVDGDNSAGLTILWEQLHPTAETQVGDVRRVTDANGRDVLEATFLQFSAAPETPGTIGSTVAPGIPGSVLDSESSDSDGTLRTITRRYIEAGDEFERVGPDRIDYDLNGLKRITQLIIAKGGTPLPADIMVGATPYDACILARITDAESTVAAVRLQLQWLQPGILFKGKGGGPVPGSIRHTWQTWMLDATSSDDMGAGNTIPGVLLEEGISDFKGYQSRRFETMAAASGGSITGVKIAYPDVMEVRTPGTVELTTIAIAAGGNAGTDAIIKHTPPRTKTVDVSVSIAVTTTPPATVAKAFDLGAISCSVTVSRASYAYIGSDIYTTVDGSNSIAVPKWRASINADISTFPNCYILGSATATGEFAYTGGSEATGLGTNNIVVTPLTSTVKTILTGTGSAAASGYTTTGIVDRKVRPLVTALDGTIYWEVITWTA